VREGLYRGEREKGEEGGRIREVKMNPLWSEKSEAKFDLI